LARRRHARRVEPAKLRGHERAVEESRRVMTRRQWTFVLTVAVVLVSFGARRLQPIGARRLQPSEHSDDARSAKAVALHVDESNRRVDVAIGGQPFTSYIWPERVKKPVLDPIRSAKGTIVTRGWPLNPRAGERVDHPHHVGLWFNYESVNGIDFWNNSDALKPEDAPKMGTILHRRIVSAR